MKPGNKLKDYMCLVDKAGSESWNRIHFTVWTGLYWPKGSRGHYPMGIDQIWGIRWRMRERMEDCLPLRVHLYSGTAQLEGTGNERK